MTPRERNMVIGILALILVGGGAFGGYTFVYSPIQETNAAIQQLQDEITGTSEKPGLEDRVAAMKKAAIQAALAKRQSLPPDINIAKTQYKILLERLLKRAKIKDYDVPMTSIAESRAPATPELAPKKPAYTRLVFHVDIPKTDIWHLADFLYEFYQLDLLHQITALNITRSNKPTETRNGLAVHLTIEAIILDGADKNRSSLFPVLLAGRLTSSGEAIAAVGGGWAVQAVGAKPELVRLVTAQSNTPVLATHARDYSLLAFRDIFYGVLPPNKTYTGITIAKIDDIKINRGDKIPDVKVHMEGDESEGAKLTATASSYMMIPEGPLKVDPITNTISFPATLENAPNYAGATIHVVATSDTGREQKTSFKVAFYPSLKDDIASAIKLIMINGSSNGIVTALIQDSANPFRYKIMASQKGIEVVKLKLAKQQPSWRPEAGRDDWRPVFDYKHQPGVLEFSDETSRTKRTFQVMAIENNKALIVADVDTKQEARPGFKRERRSRPGGGGPQKSGPVDPRAFLAITLATTIPPRVAPSPLGLYRWTN